MKYNNIKVITFVGYLLLYFVTSTQYVFASTDEICEVRLVIGSGKNVNNLYPFARKVTGCDITIDRNTKLNPSHILDIKDSKAFNELSIKYKNKFDQIVFEHVEEGFAAIVKNRQELNELMSSCQRMLKSKGSIIFESSRHASYTSDKYGNKLDFGPFYVVDQHYYPLKMIYGDSKVNALPNQKFNYVKEKYEQLFSRHKFNIVTFLIKEDVEYRLAHPFDAPYYYLEMIITSQR
ncbi:MAG: hypothetical protein AB8B66_03810 [Rickettsiaceae bacterium]